MVHLFFCNWPLLTLKLYPFQGRDATPYLERNRVGRCHRFGCCSHGHGKISVPGTTTAGLRYCRCHNQVSGSGNGPSFPLVFCVLVAASTADFSPRDFLYLNPIILSTLPKISQRLPTKIHMYNVYLCLGMICVAGVKEVVAPRAQRVKRF